MSDLTADLRPQSPDLMSCGGGGGGGGKMFSIILPSVLLDHLLNVIQNFMRCFLSFLFSFACYGLFTQLCRLIGRSVGWSRPFCLLHVLNDFKGLTNFICRVAIGREG